MKVKELTIGRRSSYHDKAGQLFGSITLEGNDGKQEVALSYGAINKIFVVIANEVAEQSEINARMTKRALQEAIDEPLVLDGDGKLKLTSNQEADLPF